MIIIKNILVSLCFIGISLIGKAQDMSIKVDSIEMQILDFNISTPLALNVNALKSIENEHKKRLLILDNQTLIDELSKSNRILDNNLSIDIRLSITLFNGGEPIITYAMDKYGRLWINNMVFKRDKELVNYIGSEFNLKFEKFVGM